MGWEAIFLRARSRCEVESIVEEDVLLMIFELRQSATPAVDDKHIVIEKQESGKRLEENESYLSLVKGELNEQRGCLIRRRKESLRRSA